MERGINGAADGAGAESADGFVDGDDAASLGGVCSVCAAVGGERFDLGIHHFDAGGTKFVDFGLAVKDKELAGLEAAFKVTTVEKFAGQRARSVFDKEMIDGVVAAHGADGLAAEDGGADRVDVVGLDVFDVGEMDAVFVAEGQVGEEIFEGVEAAFSEEFGALGTDAFDHADFGGEGQGQHSLHLYHWVGA